MAQDYKNIIQSLKEKTSKPVIFLHGEESYYIDLIIDAAIKYTLEDSERDFNQTIIYGKDADLNALLAQLKQFPMMAEKQLVIMKEAQDVKDWGPLENYFENPVDSTLFVIAHKHKKADSRKKYLKSIKKTGVLFESARLYENQIDAWIQTYLKSKDFSINPKAALLLVDFLGTDLGKIVKELDKLALVLEKGTTISEVHIEENIGVSKDYNPFELANAVAKRDIHKAHKIINYFEQNPKATHITMLLPTIFSFFERLMRVHFLRINNPNQIKTSLGVNFFVAQDLSRALAIYKPKKIAKNITLLHEYDLKSKGIDRGPGSDWDLLRELVYQLMH
jgi:DNA polymerase-3 subunit delta